MKKEMLYGIKKINVLLICVMITFSILTGCSAGTPNADKIRNDLNASDIVGSKEFFGKNNVQMTPITKLSIVDTIVEGDECEIKCNVVFEDKNYMIESQVTAFYSKFDEWSFEEYEIGDFSIVPTSGVPNLILKQQAEALVVSSVGSIVEDAYVTNITHDFDADTKTDYISFDLSAKGNVSKIDVKVSGKYVFSECWKVEDFTGEVIAYEWLYNDLVGTTWSGSVGIGATRTITFNSVDTENHTMNISYYSSTDDCSYELADYSGSQAIKVNLPNESFTDQMWILGNGSIRYGKPGGLGGMLGKRDNNKVNAQVIIDGAEDTPDVYEVPQSTSDESNSFPVIPIAIAIVIAVIIFVVVAKKRTKKSKSSFDGSPEVEDEFISPIVIDEKPATPPDVDREKTIPTTSEESSSRLKKTFPPKIEDTGFTSSSDGKTDDWFKSAGDL